MVTDQNDHLELRRGGIMPRPCYSFVISGRVKHENTFRNQLNLSSYGLLISPQFALCSEGNEKSSVLRLNGLLSLCLRLLIALVSTAFFRRLPNMHIYSTAFLTLLCAHFQLSVRCSAFYSSYFRPRVVRETKMFSRQHISTAC